MTQIPVSTVLGISFGSSSVRYQFILICIKSEGIISGAFLFFFFFFLQTFWVGLNSVTVGSAILDYFA